MQDVSHCTRQTVSHPRHCDEQAAYLVVAAVRNRDSQVPQSNLIEQIGRSCQRPKNERAKSIMRRDDKEERNRNAGDEESDDRRGSRVV